MNRGENDLKSILQPGVRQSIQPVLLGLLDKYCQSMSRRPNKATALSALLLFRLGRSVFHDNETGSVFLSDAFRLYWPQIATSVRNDRELMGLTNLSATTDRSVFPPRVKNRLGEIVAELLRGSQAGHGEVRDWEPEPKPLEQRSFEGFFGDLSDTWFAQDHWLDGPYEGLDRLSHFVARAPTARKKSRRQA